MASVRGVLFAARRSIWAHARAVFVVSYLIAGCGVKPLYEYRQLSFLFLSILTRLRVLATAFFSFLSLLRSHEPPRRARILLGLRRRGEGRDIGIISLGRVSGLGKQSEAVYITQATPSLQMKRVRLGFGLGISNAWQRMHACADFRLRAGLRGVHTLINKHRDFCLSTRSCLSIELSMTSTTSLARST